MRQLDTLEIDAVAGGLLGNGGLSNLLIRGLGPQPQLGELLSPTNGFGLSQLTGLFGLAGGLGGLQGTIGSLLANLDGGLPLFR